MTVNLLEELVKRFASPDEEERRVAVSAFSGFPFAQVKDLTFAALGDDSWRVRKEAVDLILSVSPGDELARELIALLVVQGNAGLRNSVVEVLQAVGASVLPHLVEHLAHEDAGVRKFIVDIMGGIGSPASIADLKRALDDSDPNVAAAAAESMGLIGDKEALPSLLDCLQRDDLLIRYAILEALVKIGNPVPLESITSLAGDPLLKKAVFECLGVIGDIGSAQLLIEGLTDRARNVREAALSALSVIRQRTAPERFQETAEARLKEIRGTDAVEYLIAMLESSDLRIKSAAILFLGIVGDPRAFEVLLRSYRDENVRNASLEALKCFGQPVGQLLSTRFASADEEERCIIVHISGEMQFAESCSIASAALEDSSASVRALAAEAIGKSGHTELIPSLFKLLSDESLEVRKRTTSALVRLATLASDGVAASARQLADSADPDCRLQAVRLFAALHDISPLISLSKDEDYLVRREAINALGELRVPDAAGRITMALADEEADVRLAAATALSWSGFADDADSLLLALDDSSQRVQAAAIKSIGKRKDKAAFERITAFSRNPSGMLRIAALQTLVQIDPEKAATVLSNAANDSDEEVARVASNLLNMLSERS